MMRHIALVAFACCWLGFAVSANADCIDSCMAGKDCSLNYSGACSSALSDCSAECMRNAGPAYGAIAYDGKSGAFGYSYQRPSEEAAKATAMKYCAQHGADCRVVASFADACAALAAGKKDGNPITASVISDSKEAAQSKAVAGCTANGGEDCEIEVWSCSFP